MSDFRDKMLTIFGLDLRFAMNPPNKGAAANRRYAGQLDDFMKFDCQDCIWKSRSAAVAELGR